MLPDRMIEGAVVVPPGRYLWAQFKEPGEDCPIAVIDLDEWRVCGRVHRASRFDPVPDSGICAAR